MQTSGEKGNDNQEPDGLLRPSRCHTGQLMTWAIPSLPPTYIPQALGGWWIDRINFPPTNRMEVQNKDCWILGKWKKLWREKIIAQGVYLPLRQNSFFSLVLTLSGRVSMIILIPKPTQYLSTLYSRRVTVHLVKSSSAICSHLELFKVQA